MAQPLLALLRRKAERIDVLAPPWIAPVLRRMPEVSEVIEADLRHGELQLGERWRLGRELRTRGYNAAYVLPNSWKSALVPFFAGIPERVGYLGEARHVLLTVKHPDAKAPMAEHYALLAGAHAGLPATSLKADPEKARATALKFGISGPYCVLCPGAEYGPAKRWPYFAELAQKLPLPAVLLGSSKDAEACAGVAGANLAGKTTLDEAIDLVAGAAFVVSNDSGLMHVAAALGRPLTALFGSSSPEHTPPRSVRTDSTRILWLRPVCSPCFQRVCPLGHFRCMKELGVDQVRAAIEFKG